jgi:hypothetical protein
MIEVFPNHRQRPETTNFTLEEYLRSLRRHFFKNEDCLSADIRSFSWSKKNKILCELEGKSQE